MEHTMFQLPGTCGVEVDYLKTSLILNAVNVYIVKNNIFARLRTDVNFLYINKNLLKLLNIFNTQNALLNITLYTIQFKIYNIIHEICYYHYRMCLIKNIINIFQLKFRSQKIKIRTNTKIFKTFTIGLFGTKFCFITRKKCRELKNN